MGGRLGRVALRVATAAVLLFMYFPLALIVAYAFNESGTSAWPPSGLSLRWVDAALANSGLRQAFVTLALRSDSNEIDERTQLLFTPVVSGCALGASGVARSRALEEGFRCGFVVSGICPIRK